MGRKIACLKLIDFYVTAERKLRAELEDKPVVVVKDREIIEASLEAHREGVTTDLPSSQASRICPDAAILTYNQDHYQDLFHKVWGIVAQHSPAVEPLCLHQGFADATICLSSDDGIQSWAAGLKDEIRARAGLECLIGGGCNKLIARLACSDEALVVEGKEEDFLSPISLASIEWLDPGLTEGLIRLGVRTLGELAGLPRTTLIQHFGKQGKQLHNLALGIDHSTVIPSYPPREETESWSFEGGESDELVLQQHLLLVCDRLYERLLSRGEEGDQVSLRLESADGSTQDQRQLSHPIRSGSRLFEVAFGLSKSLWKQEELGAIFVSVSGIKPRDSIQLSLWNREYKKSLDDALQALRRRYGVRAVASASSLQARRRMAELILQQQGKLVL